MALCARRRRQPGFRQQQLARASTSPPMRSRRPRRTSGPSTDGFSTARTTTRPPPTRWAPACATTGTFRRNGSISACSTGSGTGPANLEHRVSVNSGLGYHVFKHDRGFWDLFAGIGYSEDDLVRQTEVSDSQRSHYGRAELLLGQQSQHRISETTTLKQRLSFFPSLEDSDSYRGVFDATLSVSINRRFDLTAVAELPLQQPARHGPRQARRAVRHRFHRQDGMNPRPPDEGARRPRASGKGRAHFAEAR